MKFDVIIGNPPYNKGIASKAKCPEIHNMFYTKEDGKKIYGMDKTGEGHIAFYLHCSKFLKEDGILEFINPGKFLVSLSSENVRDYLFDNYNVSEISFYDCKNVFPEVSIDSIIVTHIKKGKTVKIKVTTVSGDVYYVNPYEMKNKFIPSFYNKIEFDIYKKMTEKVGYFPEHVSRNVGKYGTESEKFFIDNKTEIFCNKVLVDITKGEEIYKFTNLQNDKSDCWRIAGKEVGITYQAILEPNVLTNHTFYTIPCKDKKQAENILKYMKTNLFKLFYKRFYVTFHISAWISYIPLVDFDFNNEEELYEYFNFSQEEINYLLEQKM